MHRGIYDQLGRSHAKILKLADERKLNLALLTRKVDVKGPGMIFMGNPKNYLTKIQLPFKGRVGNLLTAEARRISLRMKKDAVGPGSDKMLGLDSTPLRVEVFGHESPMAMMRQMFAAKQAALLKQFRLNCLFDLSPRHQIQKLMLINIPIALVLFVSVEEVLRWR
jgi:hypothetical protein